jgi:FdhD protein
LVARRRTLRVLVRTIEGSASATRPDQLVVEEPLEIRLDDHLVATTMRTPGNDFELAVGWCHTDGLLVGAGVRQIRYCATGSATETEYNIVTVETDGGGLVPRPRLTTATSSCGLCGSDTIDELRSRLKPVAGSIDVSPEVLRTVPDRVRAMQDLFEMTGGVHAAAAFTSDGEPVLVREDIGRHNAVDKVVGRLLLDGGLPASSFGLFVSGRASFELVQKAWAGGFPLLLAVSAPSALAVEAARTAGITLAGFVRGDRMNVYT